MRNLDRKSAAIFLGRILDDETMPDADIIQALTDLTQKGETTEEILGFIDAMRARMVRVKTANTAAIDVCGTGGDRSGTFNISTASAIVLAAGGVSVAKHGNRAASSKCGSADVLDALSIPITSGPDRAAQLLKQYGFVFLFAQNYHPALKRLASIRKQLGFPTIFNLLGPLLNPATVKCQVIGTFSKENAERLAAVVERLEYRRVLVLTSEDGLDEASLSAPTQIIEICDGKRRDFHITPQDFGLELAQLNELQEGKDPEENAQIVRDVLQPAQELSAKQRVVVLNAALGFYVSDQAKTINQGVRLATKTIQQGKAIEKLKELQS